MLLRKSISLMLCAVMLISSCIMVTSNAQAGKITDWSYPAALQENGNYLNASDPVIDMNVNGDAIAAWTTWDSSSGSDELSVSARTFFGGEWGPIVTISNPDEWGGGPTIAMNDNGDALVAWEARDESGSLIQAVSFIDGAWGAVHNISVPVAAIHNMAISFNDNGYGLLVWEFGTGKDVDTIMAALYADGTWGAAQVISDTTSINNLPAIALSPVSGDAIAVWQQYEGGEFMLAAALCSGGVWGAPQNITENGVTYGNPSVAMDLAGNVLLAFYAYDESRAWVTTMVRSAGTGAWADGQTYNDDVSLFEPRVAMSDSGEHAVVAWMVDSYLSDYVNATVFADGAWTPVAQLGEGSDSAANLFLDVNDQGSAVALWTEANSEFNYVRASVYSNGAWGEDEIVDVGNFDVARVAMGGNGRAISVWTDMDPVESTTRAVYSIYAPPAPTVSIISPAEGYLNSTGSVTVEWTGSNVDHYTLSINGDEPVMGASTSVNLMGLADGEYNVNVTAYNSLGQSAYAQVNFVVDTTAPSLVITNPAIGAWYNSSTMNVTWTVSDAGSGLANVSVSMDGGAWTEVTTEYLEFTSLADGQHNVSVRAYDNAGNFRASYKLFNIDTELPVLSITDPEDDALINSTSVEMVWEGSSSSGIGRYWLSVDGGEFLDVGQNTSYVLSGLGEGEHAVTLRARDYAGNYNTTSIEFTVDSVAPVIDITAPADGLHTRERNITVEWTVAETGSGMESVEISIDGGEWTVVAESSFELLNLEDGTHTFAVRATDVAGNVAVRTIEISVDNEAPTATVSPSGGDVAITADITVAFSEAMNQTSVVITVDGPGSVTGTVSWNGNVATFTPSSALSYNTVYTVSVNGKDLAGNEMVETTSVFTTLKDEGAITGTIKDADGNAVANATVTLSNGMSATTDASGYFELTGVPSGSYTMNVTKDGFKTISQTISVVAGQTVALETMSLVSNASSSDGGSGWMLGIVAVVVVAMLAIGFIVYRYKKK